MTSAIPTPVCGQTPSRPAFQRARSRWLLLFALLLALSALAPAPAEAKRRAGEPSKRPAAQSAQYADRQDVAEFIGEMADRHGFDRPTLERLFEGVRQDPAVLRLIAPAAPGFKRSWHAYRARFLDPLRVREGLAFWRANEAALERAQATWQVPPEIVVAIIGVETIYGRVTGDFRVFDALTTLAFDYPRRAAFFRAELEQFLLFTREQGLDVSEVRGSFAGAIGLPQFMPGSIRRYAIDFDGDGRIDLRANPVDAIGSVARFLADHGWVGGQPTHYTVSFAPGADLAPVLAAGIEPQFTIADLSGQGIVSPQEIAADTLLALIDLPNANAAPDYYLGARNFYVITRYNRSSFYAMAVIELAAILAAAR